MQASCSRDSRNLLRSHNLILLPRSSSSLDSSSSPTEHRPTNQFRSLLILGAVSDGMASSCPRAALKSISEVSRSRASSRGPTQRSLSSSEMTSNPQPQITAEPIASACRRETSGVRRSSCYWLPRGALFGTNTRTHRRGLFPRERRSGTCHTCLSTGLCNIIIA